MAYSVASDVKSFRVCYHFRIVRTVLYPRPIPPFCHGKYVVSICVSTVFSVWRCWVCGCRSQGCHGYPTLSAQLHSWLHPPCGHHSPSSSIVDEFKVTIKYIRNLLNINRIFNYSKKNNAGKGRLMTSSYQAPYKPGLLLKFYSAHHKDIAGVKRVSNIVTWLKKNWTP